jgi:hypothetical protein
MRKLACWIAVAAVLTSCKTRPGHTESEIRYASGYSVGLDALIDDGEMLTTTSDQSKWGEEVMEQVRYLTGLFHEIDGGIDLLNSKLTVDTKSSAATPDANGLYRVRYKLEMLISYPSNSEVARRLIAHWQNSTFSETFSAPIPIRGDYDGRLRFTLAHRELCHMENHGSDMPPEKFWFYYRSKTEGCHIDPTLAKTVQIKLRYSPRNTYDRTPDYEKILADRKLIATLLFTDIGDSVGGEPAVCGADCGKDWNDKALADLLRTTGKKLTTWYGKPTVLADGVADDNLAGGGDPNTASRQINMRWNWSQDGASIEFRIFRFGSVSAVEYGSSQDARSKAINEAMRDSDIISFNGHSSYGANLDHVIHNLGDLERGHSYIYVLNGCSSFDRVGPQLEKRFLTLNPGAADAKAFFDVLANATPGYANFSAQINGKLIEGLVQRQPYREILAAMPKAIQQVVIVGEETNPRQ